MTRMIKLPIATKLRRALLLLAAVAMVIAGVNYHNSETRSRAAILSEICTNQKSEPLKGDLACLSKPGRLLCGCLDTTV